MRIHIDQEARALYLELRPSDVERTVEVREGFLADYDDANQLVGIEILDDDTFERVTQGREDVIDIPETLVAR